MTLNDFLKHGTHFDNFQKDQLQGMFNVEEIEQLPDSELTQNAAFMLSQLLVGNVDEPLKELQGMERANRVRVLQTWLDVLTNEAQINHVARFMLNLV